MTSPSVSNQVSEWEEMGDKKDPSCRAIDGFFCTLRRRKVRRIAGGGGLNAVLLEVAEETLETSSKIYFWKFDIPFSAAPMLHCYSGNIRKYSSAYINAGWISARTAATIWWHQGSAGAISLQCCSCSLWSVCCGEGLCIYPRPLRPKDLKRAWSKAVWLFLKDFQLQQSCLICTFINVAGGHVSSLTMISSLLQCYSLQRML